MYKTFLECFICSVLEILLLPMVSALGSATTFLQECMSSASWPKTSPKILGSSGLFNFLEDELNISGVVELIFFKMNTPREKPMENFHSPALYSTSSYWTKPIQ